MPDPRTPAPVESPRLYPTFRCRDAEAMIRYLRDVLGFAERVVYRRDGVVEHAELSFGSAMLMLGQDRTSPWAETAGRAGAPGTLALYLAIPDADAAHDRIRAAGGEIVMPLTDQPYGSRDFSVRDPEGNVWAFGTYWPKAGEPPAG